MAALSAEDQLRALLQQHLELVIGDTGDSSDELVAIVNSRVAVKNKLKNVSKAQAKEIINEIFGGADGIVEDVRKKLLQLTKHLHGVKSRTTKKTRRARSKKGKKMASRRRRM